MSNSVQCFLKCSKENYHFSNLMDIIRDKYSAHFEAISNLKCEFISNCVTNELIRSTSADSESVIVFTYYDTAMGYAHKLVNSYGFTTSHKTVQFGMDFEVMLNENANHNGTSFDEELDSFIDLHGEELSSFPKQGDIIQIDEFRCDDDYLLGWLESQGTPMFKVVLVEPQSNGLWIENCDCRIDLDLCTVIEASKPNIDIDFNNMEDIREKITHIFSNNNPDMDKSKLGELLISIMDLTSEIACEAHDDDEHSLTNILELVTKLQYNTESFIKSTIN